MGNQNTFDNPMKQLISTQLVATSIKLFLLFIAFIY